LWLLSSVTACSWFSRWTERLVTPTATLLPTLVRPPTRVATAAPVITINPHDNTFEATYSEAQLEALLCEKIIPKSDGYVQDISVQVTQQEIIAKLRVSAQELNKTFDVTVRGLPVAKEGQLFIQVLGYEIDPSLEGWTRLAAKTLVRGYLDSANANRGIPIPINGVSVYVDRVELRQGAVYASGRTN